VAGYAQLQPAATASATAGTSVSWVFPENRPDQSRNRAKPSQRVNGPRRTTGHDPTGTSKLTPTMVSDRRSSQPPTPAPSFCPLPTPP